MFYWPHFVEIKINIQWFVMNCAIFQVLNSNWDTWGLKDNSEWGHVCVCVCVTCFKLEKKTLKKTGPLDKYLRLLGQQSYLRMSKEIHETKAQGHPYKVNFSGFVWGSSFPCALAFWLHRLPAYLHTDKQTSGPPDL